MEPQAGIIRKGREVAYGHKLNLTTGRSGLIFDLVIEAGNPADSENADQYVHSSVENFQLGGSLSATTVRPASGSRAAAVP